MQPPDIEPKRVTNWKRMTEKGGTFMAIFVFNVALLILVSGTVVIHGLMEKMQEPMLPFSIKPPPPPAVKPPSKQGGKGTDAKIDPTMLVKPPSMVPPELIAAPIPAPNTTFNVVVSKSTSLAAPSLSFDAPSGSNLSNANQDIGAALDLGSSPLGLTDPQGVPMLTGTLYDLKKTSDGRATGYQAAKYDPKIAEYITKGWDESILNQFSSIANHFYTPQIFIPMLADHTAPKVFGVENRLTDCYWVIHYKGRVAPPSDGRYRFAGYAHATILVAINGNLVLNGCAYNLNAVDPDFPLKTAALSAQDPQAGAPAGDHRLTYGPWIALSKSQPVDIDILVGNRAAAELCAFLLIQKEGEKYEINPKNNYPILPLFQLARYDQDLEQEKESTRCQVNGMIWSCVQE